MLCPRAGSAAEAPEPPAPQHKDAYLDLYRDYVPPFYDAKKGQLHNWAGHALAAAGFQPTPDDMKVSSEVSFYTLSVLEKDDRANALIDAAKTRESAGRYRDAIQIYQMVIETYRDSLYRVSPYGVYVPAAQYAQRRLLNLPPEGIRHYQTLFDARAKAQFEQASRRYSLIGLSEIVDGLMATSYGAPALLELGNAALDQGHYLEALESFTTIRDLFSRSELATEELDLRIAMCSRLLGAPSTPVAARIEARQPRLPPAQLLQLRSIVNDSKFDPPPFYEQRASGIHFSSNDYGTFEPTSDPLGLARPAWSESLPPSRVQIRVYYQPTVTRDSVIYRHNNIICCRSILNGALRWQNDLGGRVAWQSVSERQYPEEDLLVQDGLVFTPMHKVGPSLMALDEITGQLRWAYGPVVASTEEEARRRLEAAPAGGPGTVFAGFVQDNIEGETHIDSEYGVIAFESTTGRVLWQKTLCRIPPGQFSAGFAVRRRNRIRSFTSPPVYHEGTVYYCTNAGVAAALDARSGRVKWLAQYPYWASVHDATKPFGYGDRVSADGSHYPMFWFNQRPLVVGEHLFLTPVGSPFLFCLDRKTGKITWMRVKGRDGGWRWDFGGHCYVLGPTREGHLVFVQGGRGEGLILLLDPDTGNVAWTAPDPILYDPQPVMNHPGNPNRYYEGEVPGWGFNGRWFELGAMPFLTSDDHLIVTHWISEGAWCYNLAHYSLRERKVIERRRYYVPSVLEQTQRDIARARELIAIEEEMELRGHKRNKLQERRLEMLHEIAADHVPVNAHGPFSPFSRLTFRRYGVPLELRAYGNRIEMLYDRTALTEAMARRTDSEAEFARAELAVADGQLADGAKRLEKCLHLVSSEDVDFRARIRQQLHRVNRRRAWSAISGGRLDDERSSALDMSRNAGTLDEEIETWFALADASERRGDAAGAARSLRNVVEIYGPREYPVSALAGGASAAILESARRVVDQGAGLAITPIFAREFAGALQLTRDGLAGYTSAVAPLPRPLTVRAGEFAAGRLAELQRQSPAFAAQFDALAARELESASPDEQLRRLWEFPATPTAQKVFEELLEKSNQPNAAASRRRLWELADAARICRLNVPDRFRSRLYPPPDAARELPVLLDAPERKADLAEEEAMNWLVLERRDDRSAHPNRLFLGGRVRKRIDNKFNLACWNLDTGKPVWRVRDLRLKGAGQEPGFFEAFVHADLVLVHGLYDVLAFDVNTGEPRWRFRGPFDFEIRHALISGDILVLAGRTETLALHVPTDSPTGEIIWQQAELGDLYIPPYFVGDRLISLRRMPCSVSARYRTTGKLIGRLGLPDLSLCQEHPLVEGGPEELPAAHDADLLLVTDGWYYIAVDTARLKIAWKRLIDNNDPTREPPLRFALGGDTFIVVKQDYDLKTIYGFSSRTGAVLWRTDPKAPKSPQPIYSVFIGGARAYGIAPHPGQGFYFVALDCKTGQRLFTTEVRGYESRPAVRVIPKLFGTHVLAETEDRQDFELRVFDGVSGRPLRLLKKKGVAPFGVHGRVCATLQNGRLVFLSKDDLNL